MSLKAKVEAIIYAAEEPITLEQISLLLKDTVLADLASTKENAAIEQADTAAEAAANASEAGDADAATVSDVNDSADDTKVEASSDEGDEALMPELDSESADLVTPEPGPLMPEEPPSAALSAEENAIAPETPEETPDSSQAEAAGEENAATATEGSQQDQQADTPQDASTEPVTEQSSSTDEVPADTEQAAPVEPAPAESASVNAPETTSRKRAPKKTEQEIAEEKVVRARVREVLIELITDYASEDRGMEIRQVAGGFRMATKPEHHDVVRAFAKSLKPPIRLSLAALETLAVVAYKQPVTGPEIADIRGVESASVLGTLLERKLITTAGRKQVIGRPMQYKTSKDFLMRFGLNDVNELPSMEEFSSLAFEGSVEIAPPEAQETQSLFEPDAKEPEAEGAEGNEQESENAATTDAPISESTPDGSNDVPQSIPENDTQEDATELNPGSVPAESSEADSSEEVELTKDLEAQDVGSQIPEQQPSDAAEAEDSQPQPEAESSSIPEAEHPIGH